VILVIDIDLDALPEDHDEKRGEVARILRNLSEEIDGMGVLSEGQTAVTSWDAEASLLKALYFNDQCVGAVEVEDSNRWIGQKGRTQICKNTLGAARRQRWNVL
jgi:hypothetical protein